MPPFIYRCPNTGFRVQGYKPGDTPDGGAYDAVECLICKQIHLAVCGKTFLGPFIRVDDSCLFAFRTLPVRVQRR